MYRAGLVTAICAAACAEIPDRHEPVRKLDIGVDANTMEVTGELFAVQFAQSGVRLPSAFEHGGNQLLAADICPEPSLAGISLAPMISATGGRQVTPPLEAGNTIRATLMGPAVAQIVVGYQVEYVCGGNQLLDGTSTFTIFPSGRVVRNDAVKPTQGGSLDVVSCGGCSGPKGFARFESFWNFASGGDRIEIDKGVEQMVPPGTVGRAQTTCAMYPGYGLAMSWSGPGTPTTDAPSADQSLAFRYDFVGPAMTVTNQLATGSSTIAFGPTGETCTSLAENVELPMLVIDDGGSKPLAPSAFGIYEYPTRIDGRIEIRTQSTDNYFHGVALRLELGEPDHLRIERASGEAVDFVLQRDGSAFLIWIDNGIAADDPLVIEAS